MKGKMKPPIEQDWHRFVKIHGKDKHNNWKMECLGCGEKMIGTLPKCKKVERTCAAKRKQKSQQGVAV